MEESLSFGFYTIYIFTTTDASLISVRVESTLTRPSNQQQERQSLNLFPSGSRIWPEYTVRPCTPRIHVYAPLYVSIAGMAVFSSNRPSAVFNCQTGESRTAEEASAGQTRIAKGGHRVTAPSPAANEPIKYTWPSGYRRESPFPLSILGAPYIHTKLKGMCANGK